MPEHTPAQIVAVLDRYIIGQDKAKRSVAIALRNRWRRQQVTGPMKDEIYPNNIILIGPTGVGKTEMARRLANLAHAPFIKVEASKYTEVGYVGRDVESMIRDLVDIAVAKVRAEHMTALQSQAEERTIARLLDILLPLPKPRKKKSDEDDEERKALLERRRTTRDKLRAQLDDGQFEDRIVELDVEEEPHSIMQVFSPQGIEEMGFNLQEMFGPMAGKRKKRRRCTVGEARDILLTEETDKMLDMERIVREAISRTESLGIVFLDEIDKIAVAGGQSEGPDVSREGVQRDILPVVEGTSVTTKYGSVKTDHILFIAAGAFTVAKPSDLIPELQGRFPIRVELDRLDADDFVRILTEPENALVKQYIALLKTEEINLSFTEGAIKEIADTAALVNERAENIGARRLHTVMTTLLEDTLFDAPTLKKKKITVTKTFVHKTLEDIIEDEDLSKFIL
ncbi:ATP-dependent protease ATPase subunit HslU [bacterium]|nr:ATP-dependent protease ATPase subunit HslU [bacterium]